MASFGTRGAKRLGLLGGSALALSLTAAAVAPGAGAAAPAHPHVTGVTSTQINIGATVPLSGPASPGYNEVAKAANAVFQYVNAKGGINGRKIKFSILDDQYGFGGPSTLTQTQTLVNTDNVFATVGSLGTPTQDSVRDYLKTNGVPQLFVNSGSRDWNNPTKYPSLFGWQPDYIVEAKILGNWIKTHEAGKSVGFLGQDDDFGTDGLIGLRQEVTVKSAQTYDVLGNFLTGVGTQIAALKAANVKVVYLDTVPAFTSKALGAAAKIGFKPVWVISSVGADPATVNNKLENGAVSFTWLPALGAKPTPWITWGQKVLNAASGVSAGLPGSKASKKAIDGNVEYGLGWGATFVELLKATGANLTPQTIVHTLETQGASLPTPALVPLAYSASDHQGYKGGEVITVSSPKDTATVQAGTLATTGDGAGSGITKTAGVAQGIPAWLN